MQNFPKIYKELKEGKIVVKTCTGFLNAVAPGRKLKQSIQRFKKDAGGIIDQIKHKVFLTEWKLAYQEVLDISKSCSNIKKSIPADNDTTKLNKAL